MANDLDSILIDRFGTMILNMEKEQQQMSMERDEREREEEERKEKMTSIDTNNHMMTNIDRTTNFHNPEVRKYFISKTRPDTVWIIGNGISRKNFDLTRFDEKDISIGCNAIYKQFWPNIVVSMDQGIYDEIKTSIDSIKPSYDHIFADGSYQYEKMGLRGNHNKNNAGMFAIEVAMKLFSTGLNINILGFDFLLEAERYNMGNMFDGHDNYTEETRATLLDTINRAKYFYWFIKKYKNNYKVIFPRKTLKETGFRVVGALGLYPNLTVEYMENL